MITRVERLRSRVRPALFAPRVDWRAREQAFSENGNVAGRRARTLVGRHSAHRHELASAR